MKIAMVSGSRTPQAMGIEAAERCLLAAAQASATDLEIELRVIGGRAGRRYARSVGGRWIPCRPGVMPRRASSNADLVHMLALDAPPPTSIPYVLTIHDLGGLRFTDEARFPEWTTAAITGATTVITPSEFTADEIAAVFQVSPEKLWVVANGPGQAVSTATPPLPQTELDALGVRTPIVLRIGGYTTRKNVPVLLEAWPKIRAETGASLVLAGPPQAVRDEQLAAAPSLDGIAVLDYVPAATLAGLLRAASTLVSTSVYEGFGLPPLEAMYAGVPVVAVRSRAVEEVCGDAALLVDDDADALAQAVNRMLGDAGLRDTLTSRGAIRAQMFSWESAAASLLAAYRSASTALPQEGAGLGAR
jgi:glycosyltransferase involved in cell wall biosynthesis